MVAKIQHTVFLNISKFCLDLACLGQGLVGMGKMIDGWVFLEMENNGK